MFWKSYDFTDIYFFEDLSKAASENKKLTFEGGVNFTPPMKPAYMKKLVRNRIK